MLWIFWSLGGVTSVGIAGLDLTETQLARLAEQAQGDFLVTSTQAASSCCAGTGIES
jgi:hypothetical protein